MKFILRLSIVGLLALSAASGTGADELDSTAGEAVSCSQALEPGLKSLAEKYRFMTVPKKSNGVVQSSCGTSAGFYSSSFPTRAWEFQLAFVQAQTEVTDRDVTCIMEAQRNFGVGGGGGFWSCEASGKNGKEWNSNRRNPYLPCRTHDQATALAGLLTSVSSCLGEDPRIFFKVFSTESGFNPNAFSATGADGIGQMTDTARDQIVEVEKGLSKDKVANDKARQLHFDIYGNGVQLGKPACAIVRENLGSDPVRNRKVEGCDYVRIPRGVIQSLVEAMKLRIYFGVVLETYRPEKLKKIYGADYQRLLDAVTSYSYSAAGPSTTENTFKAMVDRKTLPKTVDQFLEQLKSTLVRLRPRKYANEISHYLDGPYGMDTRYRQITKALGGGECF